MLLKKIINQVKKILLKFNIDVRRLNFYNSNPALIKKCIDFYQIDLLVDVGANIGQYGMELRKAGYRGPIISFEPLGGIYNKLKQNSDRFGNWKVYNYGVGSKEGELEINVAKNYESSSFLPVTHLSTNAAPESGYFDNEKVKVVSLDSFFSSSEDGSGSIYLKIDVQGFEMEVLNGINALQSRIKVIQLEMSFVPLYESGPLYEDILAKMKSLGFEIYTILPDFRDPVSGRMLQADGIFVRTHNG